MDNTVAIEASSRIHRLTPALANHIAAGEVVERPASVLKELLENSLDAGSTHIDVHIEGGGIGLIRVQDNGAGICKDDLSLALAQHATSKIHQLSDLDGIASYGFRGEALASIAAVSQLRLSSWVPGQAQGWTISVEGRSAESVITPAPTQAGTCIEVRHLFYNTPARRRFLRSEKTESLYVEEVFKRVVLSRPLVSFSLTQNNGVRKRYPAAPAQAAHARRVGLIGGQRFIQAAAYLEAEVHGFKLCGYVGSSAAMRSHADLQYFYVNNRIVRDKIINHAIRQAYGDRIPPGRHPAYVLYFDVDLQAVDVNVHPTKHEVRFRDARSVHDFLVYALEEGLKKAEQAEGALESGSASLEIFPSPVTGEGPAKQGVRGEPLSAPPPGLTITCADVEAGLSAGPVASSESIIVFLEQNLLVTKMPSQAGTLVQPSTLMVVDLKKSRQLWIEKTLSEQYETQSIQKRNLLWPQSFKLSDTEVLTTSVIDWERLGFDASPIASDQILLRSVPDCMGISLSVEDPSLGFFIATIFQSKNLSQGIAYVSAYCAKTPMSSEQACMDFFEEIKQTTWFMKDGLNLGCYRIVGLEAFTSE
ncbi:MAG: DNA mismatch repair endonuclease MutL [Gammaproteobacteria bacterium]|nr:DNA mismatch repair endonuclease MutL [Gammaproteobacteria bacterium]MBP9729555.1 DNA mismatch repair endonuclease MutL [Gammaproteobacteria bacterium]